MPDGFPVSAIIQDGETIWLMQIVENLKFRGNRWLVLMEYLARKTSHLRNSDWIMKKYYGNLRILQARKERNGFVFEGADTLKVRKRPASIFVKPTADRKVSRVWCKSSNSTGWASRLFWNWTSIEKVEPITWVKGLFLKKLWCCVGWEQKQMLFQYQSQLDISL